MTRIPCPSEAWDRYYAEQEEAQVPNIEDHLDAYGHLTYACGCSPWSDDAPEDRDLDWLACADFAVHNDGEYLHIAVHVVVDCESAGFVDTVDSGTVVLHVDEVDPSMLPTDLLLYWLDVLLSQGEEVTVSEYKEAIEANSRFNRDLREAVWRALE